MCIMFQFSIIFIISSRFENETKLKIKIIQQVMVNKVSVSGCLNNEATGEKRTVFDLPTDPDLQCKWLSFLIRDELLPQKHVFVCYKHFANHNVKRNNHRCKLISSINPFPTILPQNQMVINVSEA